MEANRFSDQNKILSDFYNEVWVVCPSCTQKVVAKTDYKNKKVRLLCPGCGYNKEKSMGNLMTAANCYFMAELWLQHPFKNDVVCAYNGHHLEYLESYISADLREHKDRTHFTLLEKLPKFYHEAKNRDALLSIIRKLKTK